MRFKMFQKIFLTVLLLLIIFFNIASAEEKKYPPYPDVWGYELSTNHPHIDEVAKIPDGDYMITYIKERIEAMRIEDITYKRAWVLFFSGISKDFTKDEYDEFMKKITKENREVKFDRTHPKIVFSDGSIIERGGWWMGNCSNPFERYLQKKDKAGKVIAQKMLLYLYDEPVKSDIKKRCERNWDYKKDYYFKKVDNMYEQFILLEDDTFLILTTSPKSVVIIRFDKDFNTKSDLMGKNIFLLDYKTFGDIAWKSGIDDQSVNDAVSDYLINLKKGGK